jgi:Zn-dependent protease
LIWIVVLVVLAVALVTSHRITTIEIIVFCVMIPSIILHEIAHGWVALAFGDDTAKRAGRLTLNPMAHVDPVGTLILPAVMILSGFGFFGYAKPVPVNLANLRNPRNHGVLVSLAGPATNVLIAGASAVAFHLSGAVDTGNPTPLWVLALFYLGLVNIWLAVFNMIPIPPLDGSVLFERLLPRAWWPGYLRLRRYSMPFLIVLVLLTFTFHIGVLTDLSNSTTNWWLRVLGG